MMGVTSRALSALARVRPRFEVDYCELIDAIGTSDFGVKLAAFLNQACGAEHCVVYRISAEDIDDVTAVSTDGTDATRRQSARYIGEQFWRRDPALHNAWDQGRDRPTLIRFDPQELEDHLFRDEMYAPADIRDRVLLCGRRLDAVFGISILRSRRTGAFSEHDVTALEHMGRSLISLSAKHSDLIDAADQGRAALSSITTIERRMREAGFDLSPRELQVAARILFGMTAIGIALDLGIKKESVVTYRKRGYMRLNIATRHELMRAYLRVQ